MKFSNFDGPNTFTPISTGPWPWFQKGKEIPDAQFVTSRQAEEMVFRLWLLMGRNDSVIGVLNSIVGQYLWLWVSLIALP